jgi:acetyl-CoA carboxylase biotin carboxylase subunit
MGDKASAKATMIEAGARCSWFSWYSGVIRTSARVGTIFGYPVMLKAKQVVVEKECVRSGKKKIESMGWSSSRICRCFGNDGMYLEKLIEEPRHIEIQVVGIHTEKSPF